MLNSAYQTIKKEITHKPELYQDALQDAYIKAMGSKFENQAHANNSLRLRAKQAYIDLVRKYSNMDERALDWRESASTSELYLDFQNDARDLLTYKQSQVLDYVLSGYKYKEIAEILSMGTVAVSKCIKRVVDKFRLNYTSLSEVALFEGNKGYFSENDLIYFMDNCNIEDCTK